MSDHREDEDRRPGKIEQSRACGTAEKRAKTTEIAPRLRRGGLFTAQSGLHGGDENRRTQTIIKPGSDPGQHFATQRLESRMGRQCDDDDQCQHHERVEASARQDVIVDLQQIERHRERQQIDEETEAQTPPEARSCTGRKRVRFRYGSESLSRRGPWAI